MTEETQTPETAAKSKTAKRVIENCKLPVSSIKIPEQWNRKSPGKLDDLVTSLKTHGQIVALTVRPGAKVGEYELVDGRRRILAMQEAGIKEATVTIVESADSTDAYAKSFVANMHRLPHTPVEIAKVFATLSETMNNKSVAKLCGVSEGTVSQHLGFLKLPAYCLSSLEKGELLPTEARELCRLEPEEDADKLRELHDKLVAQDINTFEAAERIVDYLDKKAAKEAGKDAKGKAKKKKGKKGDGEKGQGRPVAERDYSEAEIKLSNKTEARAELDSWAKKLPNTKSESRRQYIKGRLDGMEKLCGLRDD
jgi:ParB/RepB/Spo0J family partition protein